MVNIEIFIPLFLMIALLVIGVPVAYSLMISSTLGMIFLIGFTPTTGVMSGILHSEVAQFILSTIPMFILMAEFLREAEITTDLYKVMHYWLGHYRGGLAIATAITNGAMGALTGSSTATVAALSSIAVPEMRRYEYKDQLSIGTVAAAGTFASMIPPSLGLIILGILTETSISDLFLAALIPGILTVIAYVGLIYAWDLYDPDVSGGKIEKRSLKERIEILRLVASPVILVILVLGGIYSGATTPTEAGAVGASGAFILLLNRGGRLDATISASKRAIELTVMIFFILVGASMFGIYMSSTGFISELTTAIVSLPVPRIVIILGILAVYIVAGAVMSLVSVLIVTIPIVWPLIIDTWGYNPIWFGIVLVKMIEFALITPPLGLNVYVATSTVDVNVGTAFRGAVKFLIADLIVLLIIVLYPDIVFVLF